MAYINPNQNNLVLSENSSQNFGLSKVGKYIKEARDGRNQSIAELARELKIGEGQLTAIENGRTDLLPEKIFVKAMIRRISDKLGLDTRFILDELENTNINISEDPKEKNTKLIKLPFKKYLINFSIIFSGILGLLLSTLSFEDLNQRDLKINIQSEILNNN